MTIIEQYEAALYKKVVKIGEKNPSDEVDYDGYHRVMFFAVDGKNLGDVTFPAAKSDYKDSDGNMIPVMCIAALNQGKVVGVKEL